MVCPRKIWKSTCPLFCTHDNQQAIPPMPDCFEEKREIWLEKFAKGKILKVQYGENVVEFYQVSH